MSTTQGNHIGYDQVTVSKAGNGRRVYTYYEYNNDYNTLGKTLDDVCYRQLQTGCDLSTPYLPAIPLRYEFRRGQLKNESVYDEAGAILQSTQYNYAYDSSKIVTPCKLAVYGKNQYFGAYYERKAYFKTRTDATETSYSPIGVTSVKKSVQHFDSPFHRQVSRATETTSTGEIVETKNQYVADFRVPSADYIADGVATYQAACAACDAQYNPSKCASFTEYVCRRTAYWDNLICRANARKAYVA